MSEHLNGWYVNGMRGHPNSDDGEFYQIDAKTGTAEDGNRCFESSVAYIWVKAPNEHARAIAKQRAEVIVRAVNCHADLVAALQKMTRDCRRCDGTGRAPDEDGRERAPDARMDCPDCKPARAALAKAAP